MKTSNGVKRKRLAALVVCLLFVLLVPAYAMAKTPAALQDAPPESMPAEETLPDEGTAPDKQEETIIPTPPVPQAPAPMFWSLTDLILALGCGVLAAALLLNMLGVKRRSGQAEAPPVSKATGLGWRLAAIAAGIVAPLFFRMVHNMANPMNMIGEWTLVMATLFVFQVWSVLMWRRARYMAEEKAMPSGSYGE